MELGFSCIVNFCFTDRFGSLQVEFLWAVVQVVHEQELLLTHLFRIKTWKRSNHRSVWCALEMCLTALIRTHYPSTWFRQRCIETKKEMKPMLLLYPFLEYPKG